MTIQFVQGDLFASTGISAYAHGCNCAGAMGKGIAVEFKRRFSAMFEEYRSRCRSGEFNLGDVFIWEEAGKVVFNLGTQKTWRTKATLDAVRTSLRGLVDESEARQLDRVGLPRIGAGLGGLDWTLVRREMEEMAEQTAVEWIVFEEFQAGVGLNFG